MIDRRNPAELHETPGYHHVTVVEADRLIFLAGQCPLRPDGTVVCAERGSGTDLDVAVAQADQIATNTLAALASAGATPEHVVRTVIYVASADNAVLSAVWQRFNESTIATAFSTASTLLGVARLGFIGQLVELDVTAAVDRAG